MNGGGFEAPQWSLRVSLANLSDEAYEDIGRGVRAIARGYRQAFEAHEAGDQRRRPAKAHARRRPSPPRIPSMLTWLEQFLVRYPELALFLVIAAGYWIGSFKVGAFSLGPVTGALFAGLLVGQFAHVPVSGMTKSFLFLLFLFGIGYSVGPQFVQSLKGNGFKPVLLAIVVCVTGLAASLLVAKVLGLDRGLCGRSYVGCADAERRHGNGHGRHQRVALSEAERTALVAHVAVADAVYLHLRLRWGDPVRHGGRAGPSRRSTSERRR